VLLHQHGGIPGSCQSNMTGQRRWAIDLHAKRVLPQSPTMPCGFTPQHQQTLRGPSGRHHLHSQYGCFCRGWNCFHSEAPSACVNTKSCIPIECYLKHAHISNTHNIGSEHAAANPQKTNCHPPSTAVQQLRSCSTACSTACVARPATRLQGSCCADLRPPENKLMHPLLFDRHGRM
jgi:hypothetical protein